MKEKLMDKDSEYIAWLRCGDTGISSETIWSVMTGLPVKNADIPYDPPDFGRCYRLLEKFPEWKERLPEVAIKYPKWHPFVGNWDKMTTLYKRDLHSGWSIELYDYMHKLRTPKKCESCDYCEAITPGCNVKCLKPEEKRYQFRYGGSIDIPRGQGCWRPRGWVKSRRKRDGGDV